MDKMEEIRKMKVKEIMQTEIGWLNEDDPIEKAVNVLCSNEVSMLPVRDKKGRLIGEIVERDLLKSIIDPKNMKAHEIMFEPLIAMSFFPKKVHDVMRKIRLSFSPDDTVEEVARRMYREQTTLAPVMENKKMVGLITEDDLVRLMSEPVGIPKCTVVRLKKDPLKA